MEKCTRNKEYEGGKGGGKIGGWGETGMTEVTSATYHLADDAAT